MQIHWLTDKSWETEAKTSWWSNLIQKTLGMGARYWVKILLTFFPTPFQYLPYSYPVIHTGKQELCNMPHSVTFPKSEKDPWLLLETRRPCQGNRKEMGVKGLAICSSQHLNSDQLSAQKKMPKLDRLVFIFMFSNQHGNIKPLHLDTHYWLDCWVATHITTLIAIWSQVWCLIRLFSLHATYQWCST